MIGGDADDWDAVILVEYPSRQAFLEMTSSPKYEDVSKDRTAGPRRLAPHRDDGAVPAHRRVMRI